MKDKKDFERRYFEALDFAFNGAIFMLGALGMALVINFLTFPLFSQFLAVDLLKSLLWTICLIPFAVIFHVWVEKWRDTRRIKDK